MSNRHQRRKASRAKRRERPDEWWHPDRMPEYLIRAHAERVRTCGDGPGGVSLRHAHDDWCPAQMAALACVGPTSQPNAGGRAMPEG
jgi:hypothetical protein